jgi:hypothetical protein
MESEYGNPPPGERMRGGYSTDYPTPDPAYTSDGNWQNGGHRTPDSGHRLKPKTSGSSAGGVGPGNWDNESRKSSERNRSRQRNGRTASGQLRICKKCDKTLTGQFVRALDGTFHLECFKCRVWSSPKVQCCANQTSAAVPSPVNAYALLTLNFL